MAWHPSRRRYPVDRREAARSCSPAPGRRSRRLAADTDAWWRAQVPSFGELDLRAGARRSSDRRPLASIARSMIQSICLLGSIQPLYDALARVIERTGVGEIGVLSGSGGAEMAIVGDIWRASRGELTVDEVVANHGFHGPREGELSGRVWREDHAPLERVIARVRGPGRVAQPARARRAQPRGPRADAARAARRGAAVSASRGRGSCCRSPPSGSRCAASPSARSCNRSTSAADRRGAPASCFDRQGALDERDDIFYLTSAEWTGGRLPADAKELVARRRERRAEYEQLRIASNWKGTPTAVRVQPAAAGADRELDHRQRARGERAASSRGSCAW